MRTREVSELSQIWRDALEQARSRPSLAFRLARDPSGVLAELGFALSEGQRRVLAGAMP